MDNTEKYGWLYINKPFRLSSFGVISQLRRITGIKKIGHSGTLDPLATGLLIVAVGRPYTKQLQKKIKQDKVYEAILKLGYKTETLDAEGIEMFVSGKKPSLKTIKKVLVSFVGEIKQKPPFFSAVKVAGKRLYKLARQGKGKDVEIPDRIVKIHYIKVLDYNYPLLKIEVKVSSGTYIRSLARDIGEKLETGAYLSGLKRLSIADVGLDQAVDLRDLTPENYQKYLYK